MLVLLVLLVFVGMDWELNHARAHTNVRQQAVAAEKLKMEQEAAEKLKAEEEEKARVKTLLFFSGACMSGTCAVLMYV